MNLEMTPEQVQQSPVTLKRCPCHNQGRGEMLPVGEFHRDRTAIDGLQGLCKHCICSRRRDRYARIGSSVRDGWAATARSARRRGYEFNLSLEDYSALVARPCAYGGAARPKVTIGVDRKDNGNGYIAGNCIPCCPRHNQIKTEVFSYEDMLDICQRYPQASRCGNAKRRQARKHRPAELVM